MAPKQSSSSGYANMAYLSITEAVAGTLKFAKLQIAEEFGGPKKAMIIHRLEFLMASVSSLNSSGDGIDTALTLSDKLTDISDLSQPEVIAWAQILRLDIGAAASGMLVQWPVLRDFTELPGGGLIVPANYLYLGVKSTGAAAACGSTMRLYYSPLELKPEDYLQLLEARSILRT